MLTQLDIDAPLPDIHTPPALQALLTLEAFPFCFTLLELAGEEQCPHHLPGRGYLQVNIGQRLCVPLESICWSWLGNSWL